MSHLANRPIALVGLPGSGKSTIGRLIARRCELSFFDSDAVIETAQGKSVRAIFEEIGEPHFRQIETSTIEQLTSHDSGVISTGGGAILSPVNRSLLKNRCHCIYLRSKPEELIRRLRNDKKRPLLQVADPLSALKQLFAERDPLYQTTATFVVDTGRPSVHAVVNTIIDYLNNLHGAPHAIDGDGPPQAH